MRNRRRRIGILTGGGDCPGLNAVIRSVVKSGFYLGYEIVGIRDGFEGLADPFRTEPLNYKNTADILRIGGTILGSSNKGRFGATKGEAQRIEIPHELLREAKNNLDSLEIDGLVCTGGDGSLAIAQQLHEFGIPVVGVPKTIDNDLKCTAYSFGFDSAVACAADALDRLHTTAASHNRVMVLEVMGRHAGWIALHGGIAGGGDVILLPEIEWSFENVCNKIAQRRAMGKEFTLIVVAEGARLPKGQQVIQSHGAANQQSKLGGIGEIVADRIEAMSGMETRCVVLGHLQRGGSPTAFDRVLATQYGAHAVRLIEEERFGEMVCYDPPDISSIPIADAISHISKVSPSGSTVIAAKALGISFGDETGYINPFSDSQVNAVPAAEKFNDAIDWPIPSE